MSEMSQNIARTLIELGAVVFNVNNPITFKSGMLGPVYADNRVWPFYPDKWKLVIDSFQQLIEQKRLQFDVVAGIESAGIPHSAVLGYMLKKPSVFTRKQVKGHGTKRMVEGGDVRDKRVLLLEDLVTTGSSSLLGVDSLRAAGATVEDCIVIVKYGFPEADVNFATKKVRLHALTEFRVIFQEAFEQKLISYEEKNIVEKWVSDPWKWTKAHS
jgi:orotate phosphoribosyltransferase